MHMSRAWVILHCDNASDRLRAEIEFGLHTLVYRINETKKKRFVVHFVVHLAVRTLQYTPKAAQ